MKILTLMYAALLAVSLSGAAHAAAPADKEVVAIANTLPANYANNPANGAFSQPDNSDDDIQPAARNKDSVQLDAAAAPVPEPQIFLMMLTGLVLLGLASSRREANEKFTD